MTKFYSFSNLITKINKKRTELGMSKQHVYHSHVGILRNHMVMVTQFNFKKHKEEFNIWIELRNGSFFYDLNGKKRKNLCDTGDFYQLADLFNDVDRDENKNKKLYEFVKNEIGIYEIDQSIGVNQVINARTKEILITFEK